MKQCYVCNKKEIPTITYPIMTITHGVDKLIMCNDCQEKLIKILAIQCPEQLRIAIKLVPIVKI